MPVINGVVPVLPTVTTVCTGTALGPVVVNVKVPLPPVVFFTIRRFPTAVLLNVTEPVPPIPTDTVLVNTSLVIQPVGRVSVTVYVPGRMPVINGVCPLPGGPPAVT